MNVLDVTKPWFALISALGNLFTETSLNFKITKLLKLGVNNS